MDKNSSTEKRKGGREGDRDRGRKREFKAVFKVCGLYHWKNGVAMDCYEEDFR